MRRWRAGLLLVATICGAALTARLGLWQLDRAAQKLALQSDIRARSDEPLLDGVAALAKTATQAQDQEHRRVRVSGLRMEDKELHVVFPRDAAGERYRDLLNEGMARLDAVRAEAEAAVDASGP